MARPRLHDDALRERLLAGASELVSTRGAPALTVRDLAARVGTSPSAVYSLFGSREDLVHAVGDAAFARFAARLAAVPRTPDPGADLLELGLAYRRHAVEAPHEYRVMFGVAGAGAQEAARGEATRSATFLVLRDAVAALVGPDGADRPAMTLWALVHGLVELELNGLLPSADAASRFEQALQAAGPAILAPPS
ncbi:TetR/AcrR family transcriptional regulator [Cellulomonas sp. PhB150]|uniref:TetR/AcrR family transcriptional regulator n=1 Tax=Cellulomonas sp. PhB150 TaxID=2485188 RepID=UPI000F496E89|nr:TetR/AcrR family transcriptional regulator [Cellulomonas sp. PhB150]ROS28155.1 TetR family transcriptional regulator [Cellulomonas sp. PhB150]